MDTETITIIGAVAGGGVAVKILDQVFAFVTRNGKNGKNGYESSIIDILQRQVAISARQEAILENIGEVSRENGKKLESIASNLTLAMDRQTRFYAKSGS